MSAVLQAVPKIPDEVYVRQHNCLRCAECGAVSTISFERIGLRHNRGCKSSGLTRLTQREKQVAVLICEGLSFAEIAEHLGIALPTAKNFGHSIYRRLGVKKAVLLQKELYKYGFLKVEDE